MRYDIYFYFNGSDINCEYFQNAHNDFGWSQDFDHFIYMQSGFVPTVGQVLTLDIEKVWFIGDVLVTDIQYTLTETKSKRAQLKVNVYVEVIEEGRNYEYRK